MSAHRKVPLVLGNRRTYVDAKGNHVTVWHSDHQPYGPNYPWFGAGNYYNMRGESIVAGRELLRPVYLQGVAYMQGCDEPRRVVITNNAASGTYPLEALNNSFTREGMYLDCEASPSLDLYDYAPDADLAAFQNTAELVAALAEPEQEGPRYVEVVEGQPPLVVHSSLADTLVRKGDVNFNRHDIDAVWFAYTLHGIPLSDAIDARIKLNSFLQ